MSTELMDAMNKLLAHERAEHAAQIDQVRDRIFVTEDFGTVIEIVKLTARTRKQLSERVSELNPGRVPTGSEHDCSGRVCRQDAKLLRAYEVKTAVGELAWVGVVELQTAYDI